MRPITLQRLQVFCSVYEKASITAAARHLRLSQPTVSRHLRDFEAALGLSLFVMDRGQIVPTAQADAIYADSAFLQSGIKRLEHRIDHLRAGAGLSIALMSIDMLVDLPVPQAIKALRSEWPELALSVDVGTSAQQMHLLKTGQIDIGLLGGDIADDSVQRAKVGSGDLVALLPKSHAMAAAQTVTLSDLAAAGALSLSSRGPIARIVNDQLAAHHLEFSSGIVTSSLAAAPGLVQALGQPAIIDEFTARTISSDALCIRPLDTPLRFDLYAVSFNPSETVQVFQSALVKALSTALSDLKGPG